VSAKTLPNIVKKGYVAVDGTSLTVCEVHRNSDGSGWFNLMLIAHTQKCIVLPHKAVGAKVNLEADVLGKYAAEAAGRQVAVLEERVQRLEWGLLAIAAAGVAALTCYALTRRGI